MAAAPRRPCIALTLGDPAGIGPEICLAAAADERVRRALTLVLVGPARCRPDSIALTSVAEPCGQRETATWIVTPAAGEWELGRVQAESGRAALAALRTGHELALGRRVDALVTAPVSKEALHLAGERVEGQTELLGRWCGVERYEMLAVAGELRVMLLTRHMPLRAALELVTRERVLDHLDLLDSSLRALGVSAPRLALAGLNPHAGENGLLGREDDEILRPAVESARGRGLDVRGPISPDTVFLHASQGRYDGVLALYHDQAFIPVKLLSHDGGVTVIAGLPYLRVSPVHGTAFDIAGKGLARAENLVSALLQAARWVEQRGMGESGAR
jgi:4-hydroxythreonine-4-phosphate dehydrogenase